MSWTAPRVEKKVAKRCPRCNRSLIDVDGGRAYLCSGCHQAPAYCDCMYRDTSLEDPEFVEVESEFVLESEE